MKIVIMGLTGQLGTGLIKVLQCQHGVIGPTHHDIEVMRANLF